MRGARRLFSERRRLRWIIPADAGSTPSRPYTSCPSEDHPRGCGEHRRSTYSSSSPRGSSPRMRGAHNVTIKDKTVHGIIPADAGSTTEQFSRNFAKKDHPRGCGEHRHYRCLEWAWRGSSPRMRGAPCLTVRIYPWPGIIPADAGSTRACRPC